MKKIYLNGDIITLGEQKIEAIMTENKIISKLGTKDEILKLRDKDTQIIDLNNKTIMPAFIDAHSHFFGVANNFLQLSLKECASIKEIKEKIKQFKIYNNIDEGKWIIANNYDYTVLADNRNITKEEIDKITKNNPVVIQNKSGHSGIFNSKGLEKLNITKSINGLIEEKEFIENIKKVPMPNITDIIESCIKAQNMYASQGITTVQEGMFVKELIPIYKQLLKKNILKLDLIAYMDINAKEEIKSEFKENINKYNKNFKIAGYKIFLDGSPQLRTAWLRKTYIGSNQFYGYNSMTDEEVKKAIGISAKDNMQILAHCNGDKAAEQYIKAIKELSNIEDIIRPTIIHAQFLGIDQLDEVKKYKIILSFFIAHTYYWGDTHIKNMGVDRTKNISPANSSLKKDVLFTFHQDSPVIEPNMFETIWCALKRETKKGIILNKNERINIIDAIKAVTINVAKQYGEESLKGSIEEGKLANLIILDKKPLKIDINEIKQIKILETIKEGETIYKMDS